MPTPATNPKPQLIDPVWDNSDGASAPHPEPDEEYLVEIQQNLNGKDVRWHRVMLWCHVDGWNCEDGGRMIQLGPTQVARRWCKISEIGKGWVRERRTWKGE